MAILHMDGFDNYSSAADLNFTYGTNGVGFSTTAGRYGGGCVQSNGGGQLLQKNGNFPAEFWTGFALWHNDNSNQACILLKMTSQYQDEAFLTYNPGAAQLIAWKGRQNQQLGLADVTISPSQWHWIDVHWKADYQTAGIFEVWLDGTQVINFTGGQTQQTGGVALPGLNSISLFDTGTGTLRNTACYDDWVIVDTTGTQNNGRIGDSRIETLKPNSDAGTNNGTPSTGSSHYGPVADANWDSSTYDTITNTSGQEELFGFTSLSAAPSSVAAVKINHISQKTDTGDASLETVLISSGTEADGTATALGTAWAIYSATYELDPHTSAAWTGSAVNALQAGVKVP